MREQAASDNPVAMPISLSEKASSFGAISLKEIAAATGLSLAACSRIRADAKAPHPRHWDGLFALVEAGD
jgi:hypothetical protein